MKRLLNGEVFFILFLMSGFYKGWFVEVFKLDPTALFFALSLLSALFRVYKRGYIYNESVTPIIIYLAISLLMLTSIYFAGTNSYPYDKTFKFVTITAWSFAGVFFLTNPNNPIESLKRYLYTFLIVGIAMVSDVFISNNTDESGFITALGSNYIALGRIAGISALITLSCLVLKKNTLKKNILLIILTLLFVYVMLVSGGRMPVISFAICVFLLIALNIKITSFDLVNVRFRNRTLYLAVTLITLFPFLVYYLSKSDLAFTSRFISLFSDGGVSETSRAFHYDRAWDMFIDTWLLGSGIGNYSAEFVADVSYPHNIFLEIASELGLIGLLLFTTLIIIAVRRYFISFVSRYNFHSMVILLLFVFNFSAANVAGDINDNRVMFFTISLLLLSRVFKRDKVNQGKPTREGNGLKFPKVS